MGSDKPREITIQFVKEKVQKPGHQRKQGLYVKVNDHEEKKKMSNRQEKHRNDEGNDTVNFLE